MNKLIQIVVALGVTLYASFVFKYGYNNLITEIIGSEKVNFLTVLISLVFLNGVRLFTEPLKDSPKTEIEKLIWEGVITKLIILTVLYAEFFILTLIK